MSLRRAAACGAIFVTFGLLAVSCDQSSSSSPLTPKQQGAVLVNAGNIAQNAQRSGEARGDYNRAMIIDPTNKYAYYNLGYSYQKAGDNADAATEYQIAIGLDKNFVSALFNLAIILTPCDKVDAESLYRRVIGAQPNYAAAHLNLGFLLVGEGKLTAGKAELDEAVKLDPSLAARAASPAPPTPCSTAPTPTP